MAIMVGNQLILSDPTEECVMSFKNLALASAAIGLVLSSASSASAQERRYHHENDAGAMIVGGVLGIIIGAAIAGDHHSDRRYEEPQRQQYAPPPQPYYPQQGPQTLCVLSYSAYTRQTSREYITFQFGDESWRNYRPC